MQKTIDFLDGVSRVTGRCVRWFALAMLLIQFAIVVARYAFGYSTIATQESVLYLHAALFMLGAGYTLLVDGHVRVDILYEKLGAVGKRRVDLAGHLFLLMPAMIMVLYWSWPAVRNAWSIFEGPLSVGGIRGVFLLKSLIPTFCALVMLQSLSCILRLLLESRPRHG